MAPAALAVAAALVVSVHSTSFDFVLFDDDYLVYRNPTIRELGNIPQFFNPFVSREQMGSEFLPLITTSYAVDYALYGSRPGGFHLTNVVLYAAAAGFLYLLLFALTNNRWAACAGALLFAVHPLHVESFAWISARKSLLNGAFAFLSVWAFVRFRGGAAPRRWYVLSVAAYLGAFLSKYTAASLPLVLLAYDRWLCATPRPSWRQSFCALVPFGVVGGLMTALALRLGVNEGIVKSTSEAGLWTALVNDPIILLHYLRMLFVPIDLCAFYLWPIRETWTLEAIGGCALAIGLVALAWRWRGRAPLAAFAIVWFLVFLTPVLNAIPKGIQIAERYLFLSSAALAIGTAWVWRYGANRTVGRQDLRRSFVGLGAAVCLLLGGMAVHRSLVWRDSLTLWHTTVEHPNANPAAIDQLGLTYLTLVRDPENAAKVFRVGLAEMDRRGTPLSPLARELRFHLVLSLLERGGTGTAEARVEMDALRRLCEASGDPQARVSFATWSADLKQNYPQLYEES